METRYGLCITAQKGYVDPWSFPMLEWLMWRNTQDDGSACSVFVFNIDTHRSRLPLAKNAMHKSRTLRHPGVIKVLDTIEVGSPILRTTANDCSAACQMILTSYAERTHFVHNHRAGCTS